MLANVLQRLQNYSKDLGMSSNESVTLSIFFFTPKACSMLKGAWGFLQHSPTVL